MHALGIHRAKDIPWHLIINLLATKLFWKILFSNANPPTKIAITPVHYNNRGNKPTLYVAERLRTARRDSHMKGNKLSGGNTVVNDMYSSHELSCKWFDVGGRLLQRLCFTDLSIFHWGMGEGGKIGPPFVSLSSVIVCRVLNVRFWRHPTIRI